MTTITDMTDMTTIDKEIETISSKIFFINLSDKLSYADSEEIRRLCAERNTLIEKRKALMKGETNERNA